MTASAAALILAAAAPAQAKAPTAYDIPAGDLGSALEAFTAQSSLQILYTSDQVQGRRTLGVVGRYTQVQALEQLLQGSGLHWSWSRPGVVTLKVAASGPSAISVTQVDEIVVTGSLLRRSGDPASPVLVIDRSSLDESGRGSVADVLASLPQNYAGSGTVGALLTGSDPSGSNAALSVGVNLRGLGPDATLTLVDGRRLAGSGSRGEFSDVSALPSAAVERVDVLLDGASALYGADAVAGVVNVVMKRRFDGQESRVRAAASVGGAEEVSVSHLIGRSWSNGSAFLALEYESRQPLSTHDRDYATTGDLRSFGGSDHRTLFSSPGNIVVNDPAAGGYRSRWAIQPGPGGPLFLAGETNLYNTRAGVDLLPDLERFSGFARWRQAIGDQLELSADLRFNRRTHLFKSLPTSTVMSVGRANPHFHAPDGAASHLIAYSFGDDLGPTLNEGETRSLGATLAATVELPADWQFDAYLAYAEERGESRIRNQINTRFLAEALGNLVDDPTTPYSAAVDGHFNPYGAGGANSPTILDFISSGYSDRTNRSRVRSANILAEGPLFQAPGGAVRLAVGAQVRSEALAREATAFTSTPIPTATRRPEESRTVAAVFVEARAPLIGEALSRPGLRRLDLSLAARAERFDDVGSAFTPKAGLVWSPADAWTIKASYGAAFRAPALTQVFDPTQMAPTLVPQADGSRLLAIFQAGGNTDLKPETARTLTIGVEHRFSQSGRLSLGYFDTRFKDRISQPANENLAGILTDPTLTPFVRRLDPTRPEDRAFVDRLIADPGFLLPGLYPPDAYRLVIDARWANSASVEVRGLDLQAAVPFRWRDQAFEFNFDATRLLDYRTQTTIAAPTASRLGVAGFPAKLRGGAGLAWRGEDWSTRIRWNYVNAYRDVEARRIDAWNTLDLGVSWAPGDGRTQWVGTIRNLADARPPFYDSPTGIGFDPGLADPLGRTASLLLIRRW